MSEKRVYTEEERREAVEHYRLLGPAKAAKLTGFKSSTIKSWARREGVTATSTLPERQGLRDAQLVTMEQRRLATAEGLMKDVARLRSQLFAPCERIEVKTVGLGDGRSEAEQVAVMLEEPTFTDKLAIVRSISLALEKVQLLTGEATQRQELTGGYDLENELAIYQAGLADRNGAEHA